MHNRVRQGRGSHCPDELMVRVNLSRITLGMNVTFTHEPGSWTAISEKQICMGPNLGRWVGVSRRGVASIVK